MTTTTTTTAKIFLTDYASYNNGTQFEFGHWVDLSDFQDEDDLNDYITNHFEECDEKSPLPCGSTREETMITDFEDFPEEFYSESGCTFEKIFKYIEIDFENLDDSEKVTLWNEYCIENKNGEDEIYSFDDEFFEIFFLNKPMEAARAASFGTINWSDNYITFDGNGNLESIRNPIDYIEETELIEWLMNG
jgi:hypothetical protein